MTQRQKQKVIGTETTSKLYDYTDTCVEYFCNIVYSRWDFYLVFYVVVVELVSHACNIICKYTNVGVFTVTR